MKNFMLLALMLSSFSSFAQANLTVLAKINVGACIVSNMIDDNQGDEWKLSVIPLNSKGEELVNQARSVKKLGSPEFVSYGRTYTGPYLSLTIDLKKDSQFKIKLTEEDWGVYGADDEYDIGIYSTKQLLNTDTPNEDEYDDSREKCLELQRI